MVLSVTGSRRDVGGFAGLCCKLTVLRCGSGSETRVRLREKLVLLLPRMLLQPTEETGDAGKELFYERFRQFQRGEWLRLLGQAAANNKRQTPGELDAEAAAERRREQAESKGEAERVRGEG